MGGGELQKEDIWNIVVKYTFIQELCKINEEF
jgi:hypothetical protein